MMISLNLILCLAGGWICICRAGMMTGSETKGEVRAQNAAWFVFFACSGVAYTCGWVPTPVQIFMTACGVVILLIGWGAWRHGAPHWTRRSQ